MKITSQGNTAALRFRGGEGAVLISGDFDGNQVLFDINLENSASGWLPLEDVSGVRMAATSNRNAVFRNGKGWIRANVQGGQSAAIDLEFEVSHINRRTDSVY